MANEIGQVQNAIRESALMAQNRSQSIADEQGRLELDRQKQIDQFQQEYINAETEPGRREVLRQQLAFLRGGEPERPIYKNVKQQVGPMGETEDRLLKSSPDGRAEYVQPQYTGQELAKYRTMLGAMEADERTEYLESLRIYNPSLFNALRASYDQKRSG